MARVRRADSHIRRIPRDRDTPITSRFEKAAARALGRAVPAHGASTRGEGRAVTVRIHEPRRRVPMVDVKDLERRTRPRATDGPGDDRYRYEQLGGSHAKGGEYQHWLKVREP